jgi:hypothetical protein
MIDVVVRDEKLKDLKDQFNFSKKITIKNGSTLIIEHDTNCRNIFIKHLETAISQTNSNMLDVLEFRAESEDGIYSIRACSYLWKYVFKAYNTQRVDNKFNYDVACRRITKATDIDELQSISWRFADTFELDVNKKIAEIELDAVTHPVQVLDLIDAAKDAEGIVHLVKKICD